MMRPLETYTETELLTFVHDILAKPQELTDNDRAELEEIDSEFIRRQLLERVED